MLGDISLDPEDYPEFAIGRGWGPLPDVQGVGAAPSSGWSLPTLLVSIGALGLGGYAVGGWLGKQITHSQKRAKKWANVGGAAAPTAFMFLTWYAASQIADAGNIVLTPSTPGGTT
jgi:hypothetical protein